MVFCYYAHNSVWTCELGYGADTMFHRTYFLLFVMFGLHVTFVVTSLSFVVQMWKK